VFVGSKYKAYVVEEELLLGFRETARELVEVVEEAVGDPGTLMSVEVETEGEEVVEVIPEVFLAITTN
jgi:hypothetical protein